MCSRDKIILITLLLYVMVQCCIHMIFCIWGINMMKCNNKPLEKKGPMYFLYLTYFLNSSCLEATFEDWLPQEHNGKEKQNEMYNWSEVPDISFPEFSPARERTYYAFHMYVVLNSALIATSLLLLIGVCFNVKKRLSLFFYVPYLLVMFVVILCDMIVTGRYAGDIPATYGLRKWHHFLNREVDEQVIARLNLVASRERTSWPAIFMTALFGRFIVFWFLNVCIFFYIKEAALFAFYNRPPVTRYLISASCGTLQALPKTEEPETGKIQKT